MTAHRRQNDANDVVAALLAYLEAKYKLRERDDMSPEGFGERARLRGELTDAIVRATSNPEPE